MVDFVKPNLLGTKKEFLNRFANPINNGRCSNSTPRDVKIMKQRCHVLYQLLSGCVQVNIEVFIMFLTRPFQNGLYSTLLLYLDIYF